MALLKWYEVAAYANIAESADFNALANGSGVYSTTTTSGIFDNTTDLATHAEISFMCTSNLSPAAGGRIDVFALPVMHDGSTYADGDAGSTQANQPVGAYVWASLPLRSKATQPQNSGSLIVPIPFLKAKIYVMNRSGVAMPSNNTDCTLKARRLCLQST